jgi:hypothetical protein
MRHSVTLFFTFLSFVVFSQTASLNGQLKNENGEPIPFANVALFNTSDSSLYKVGTTNELGAFEMLGLDAGVYNFKAIYLGINDLEKKGIELFLGRATELGVLQMSAKSLELRETTISATRVMLEVKPDRTIFNVEGTINSAGNDALTLLRKAPSVTVDNNDNINLLGRAGVLIYVDGKRLPLTGEELSSYLQNLPAEQIDRFEIITNPGAKYEAEGNAGIIDIRLKKDKNQGANGSLNLSASQGDYHKANLSGTGNWRKKRFNVFGNAGIGDGIGVHKMLFYSELNNIVQDEINNNKNDWRNYNYRVGADLYADKKQTIGVLVSGNFNTNDNSSYNRITLAQANTPTLTDSILVASNTAEFDRMQQAINLNYRFDNGKGRTFNMDADYANFHSEVKRFQPNRYYNATEDQLKSEYINNFDTPSDIDIYTLQLDYEDDLLGGKMGLGAKYSQVVSDNTFLAYNVINQVSVLNNMRSNVFDYDERVYAAYANYSRALSAASQLNIGLRAEQTDATGDLTAFLPELQEPRVKQDYLSLFPTFGITWQTNPKHAFAFNTGRRINRPDYNVLNPFFNQISELSYEQGNSKLQPEIVNNIELGYTLAYRYHFKLGYSHTTNQITRLIGPSEDDPRAGYITWANLASQSLFSFNASAPVDITKNWSAFFNLSASHINNQADYGDGKIVDIQAFTYNIYQQQTISLPGGYTAEISGWFNGPGVWGGVFLYETSWSLDLGIQKKFLQKKLNVKLSASDIFYQSGWDGVSSFDGLVAKGGGRWDSRRVSLSLGYRFGNENIKSRNRSTSNEAEAGRVKSE